MYSKEHLLYLKKQKRLKIFVIFTQIMIVVLFLLLWQFLADTESINTFIFSSPKNVIDTLITLHRANNIYQHIWITIYETLISFSIGTILGIFIATILWRYRFFARVMDPYLTILNSLPKVALGPIIIIWAGANMNSIILMALLISVIVTIMNIYQGFCEIDSNKIKLLKSLRASEWQIYTNLILPGSIHTIISTLKINVSMSLIGLLPPVGEKIFFNKCYSRY